MQSLKLFSSAVNRSDFYDYKKDRAHTVSGYHNDYGDSKCCIDPSKKCLKTSELCAG